MSATQRVSVTQVAATTLSPAVVKIVDVDVNAVRNFLADGMLTIGTVIISATATRWKTTTTLAYKIAGIVYTKVATDSSNTVFTTAGTINTGGAASALWGAWLVQIDATGTFSTKAPGGGTTDQVYASEALAKAAAIALGPDASNVQVAVITIQGLVSTAWVANTGNMTVGGGAGNVTARNFYDIPAPAVLPAAL
jgi:hypothetical protein